MDYIDQYQDARINKFSTSEDKKARENFYEGTRKDIQWAKNNSLIREMSFEDYLEVNNRPYSEITPEMRKVILSDLNIPTWILAQYYELAPSTVTNLRRKSRVKAKEEGTKC
jgi:hypothetical protein